MEHADGEVFYLAPFPTSPASILMQYLMSFTNSPAVTAYKDVIFATQENLTCFIQQCAHSER